MKSIVIRLSCADDDVLVDASDVEEFAVVVEASAGPALLDLFRHVSFQGVTIEEIPEDSRIALLPLVRWEPRGA